MGLESGQAVAEPPSEAVVSNTGMNFEKLDISANTKKAIAKVMNYTSMTTVQVQIKF